MERLHPDMCVKDGYRQAIVIMPIRHWLPTRPFGSFVFRRISLRPNPQQHVQPCFKIQIDFVQELIACVNVLVWHPQRVGPLRADAIIRLNAEVGKFGSGDDLSGEGSNGVPCFAGIVRSR